jgi:hypothetical protein
MRAFVRRHIQETVTQEWPVMAQQRATVAITSTSLVETLELTLVLTPRGDGQVAAQREIATSLQSALDARRQRIIITHLLNAP